MGRSAKTTTIMLNFREKLDIYGDPMGDTLFTVPFLCTDSDGKYSCYNKIYRANSKKECLLLARLECGRDDFDNETKLGEIIEIGTIR